MKKLLVLSALVLCLCTVLGALVYATEKGEESETAQENYIWVLEAQGGAETQLCGEDTEGIAVSYDFAMNYVSVAGTALASGSIPTRFVGSASLHASYDLSASPEISELLQSVDTEYDFSAEAWCATHTELGDFEYAYDGSFAAEFHFHSSESSFSDSEDLLSVLGDEGRLGLMPGSPSDHGYGDLVANVYVNAEPDESEIGYGRSHGVRTVMVLVTVYGSPEAEDEFSFELSGTLKRIPCTLENVYRVKMSDYAPVLPDIELGSADGREALGSKIAVSRIRSSLLGREPWPFEALPEGFPELYDVQSLEYGEGTAENVLISAVMTSSQLSGYKKKLGDFGLVDRDGLYCGDEVLVKLGSKKFVENKKTYYDVELFIIPTVKATLSRDFEQYFPEFSEGYATRAPYGEGVIMESDYAWLSDIRYGIGVKEGEAYGKVLKELGFEEAFDEYTKREGDYRFTFAFSEYSDEISEGLLLSFYVVKEEVPDQGEDSEAEDSEDSESGEEASEE